MDFTFTEDQRSITEAARDMLVDSCTPADLRRLLETRQPVDRERWTTIREMGLLGTLAPEAAGGLGLLAVDFVGIAEAAGYVALPEPLVDQAGVAVPLLASLDDNRGWLGRVLEGEVVAVGHPSQRFVADADHAQALLLPHGNEVHLVGRNEVELVREPSVDPFRRLFRVIWTPSDDTRVSSGWGLAAEHGTVFAAAQMIGLGQRCIDMAVAYAKDRTQFGKPIGSYQAVKHLLATAQVKIEFARPVVQAAAAELAMDTLASRARIAHAAIAAGEAAEIAARSAVQAHGAMGITWEVDLHFFLKRALALKTAWGTPARHRATVIERMRALPTGPAATFASEVGHQAAPG